MKKSCPYTQMSCIEEKCVAFTYRGLSISEDPKNKFTKKHCLALNIDLE